eukprot:m.1621719 g.1621719  ORF g.1621719 m.1621719 type:complete len:632 (+) comp25384_c1_seq15:5436-7331(+)
MRLRKRAILAELALFSGIVLLYMCVTQWASNNEILWKRRGFSPLTAEGDAAIGDHSQQLGKPATHDGHHSPELAPHSIVLTSPAVSIALVKHKNSYRYRSISNNLEAGLQAVQPDPELFRFIFKGLDDGVQLLSSDNIRLIGWKVHAMQNVSLLFASDERGIELQWTCTLWGNVLQMHLSTRVAVVPIAASNQAEFPEFSLSVDRIEMLSFARSNGFRTAGSVQGCPVVFERAQLFYGIEHPMSNISEPQGAHVRAQMPFYGQSIGKHDIQVSAAFGAFRHGQLRRSFGDYLEQIRARPWRQWLHYNSWYQLRRAERMAGDASFRAEDAMNETNVLRVMQEYADNLVKPSGIDFFKGFLLDDGWDDYTTLWKTDTSDFPRGFQPLLRNAIENRLGALGVWVSPWGGYDKPRSARMKYGQTQGFEVDQQGFSLAGPKYFERFVETCSDFVRNNGVTFFKFDGIAGGFVTSGPPPQFALDVFGLFRLVQLLRKIKDDLFINLTVGTWPSPYLLKFADSIWRGDLDTGGWGRGRKKQRWITYRDEIVYRLIVRRSTFIRHRKPQQELRLSPYMGRIFACQDVAFTTGRTLTAHLSCGCHKTRHDHTSNASGAWFACAVRLCWYVGLKWYARFCA